MEEAAELANYLPLSFKTPKEQEYIEFLWDAFETNHTHGKYQFAFLAYHMLTMSFVVGGVLEQPPITPAALPGLPPVGGYNASASARSCAR